MIVPWVLLTATALKCALARTPLGDYQVLEHLESVPQGWRQGAPTLSSQRMKFRIAPKLDGLDEFSKMVIDLSTPGSATYGHFMTREQVKDFVRPAPDASRSIHEWLTGEGIPADVIEDTGDWIKFSVPVEQAEKLMQAQFKDFQHVDSGRVQTRTLHYSVPRAVASYIDTIQPTTFFGQAAVDLHDTTVIHRRDPGRSILVDCNVEIVPGCLRRLYNFAGYEPLPDIGNSIAVTGFLGQYANIQDLERFYAQHTPDALNSSFGFISVNGGINDQQLQNAGEETGLDVQYAFSLSFPIPATLYSTAGEPPFQPTTDTPRNTNEPYAEFLDYVLNQDNPPLVIATSYGDEEQTVPRAYAQRICAQFAQLSARGVSLIFASGDAGVGKTCLTNDGKNETRFLKIFPATCPFVTSVGATYGINPEIASELSQGGFSDYFSRPSYQDEAVEQYLNQLPSGQWRGLFDRNGRGFPDVAAQGMRYHIVHRGQQKQVSGTR